MFDLAGDKDGMAESAHKRVEFAANNPVDDSDDDSNKSVEVYLLPFVLHSVD